MQSFFFMIQVQIIWIAEWKKDPKMEWKTTSRWPASKLDRLASRSRRAPWQELAASQVCATRFLTSTASTMDDIKQTPVQLMGETKSIKNVPRLFH